MRQLRPTSEEVQGPRVLRSCMAPSIHVQWGRPTVLGHLLDQQDLANWCQLFNLNHLQQAEEAGRSSSAVMERGK